MGFPVKSASAEGAAPEEADFVKQLWRMAEDHEAHADGKICGRCNQVIAAGHDARRRAHGDWVHASCSLTVAGQ